MDSKHVELSIDCEDKTFNAINTLLLASFNESAIKIEILGGLSNRLYKCTTQYDCVVIRVKSSEVLRNELSLLQFLSRNNQTAPVLITFQNGYISRYIPGIPLDRDLHRSPEVLQATAIKLRKLHSVSHSDLASQNNNIWTRMTFWLDSIKEYDRNKLREEMKRLHTKVEELNIPMVFCHNDLACENILLSLSESNNPNINFIDWEYSSYNYSIYDIANHFQEWTGNSLREPMLSHMEMDVFLNSYFDDSKCWDTPTFREQLRICTLLSDLHWSVWAFHRAQSKKSVIEFDYLDYGRRRLKRSFPLLIF